VFRFRFLFFPVKLFFPVFHISPHPFRLRVLLFSFFLYLFIRPVCLALSLPQNDSSYARYAILYDTGLHPTTIYIFPTVVYTFRCFVPSSSSSLIPPIQLLQHRRPIYHPSIQLVHDPFITPPVFFAMLRLRLRITTAMYRCSTECLFTTATKFVRLVFS